MKVVWSRRALRQLRDAHAYIARDNPTAAREFLDAAEALATKLGEFPGMGLETDEPGVILFPFVRYRYLLYYEIRGETVYVLRLWHASRKRP